MTVFEEIDGESRWELSPEQWARIEASERSALAGRTRPLDDVVADIKANIAARADSSPPA